MNPTAAFRCAFAMATLFTAHAAIGCGGSSNAGGSSSAQQGSGDAGDQANGDAGGGSGDGGLPEAAPVGTVPYVVPLTACEQTLAYTASIILGGTQTFDVLVDTGSTTLAVADATCSGCNVKTKYTPGSTAVDKMTTASSQYGSGSWSGKVYEDGVQAPASPVAPVDFASITKQTSFFQPLTCPNKSGSYQGILGLGPTAAAVKGTNGFFDQLVSQLQVPNVFAVQLCDNGGTLWLGGFDAAATTGAPVYTPEIAGIDTYYYAIDFESITLAGNSIPVATAQYKDAVVDTGTSIFVLPTSAVNAIANAVSADAGFTAAFGNLGASWFSNPANCAPTQKTKAELDASLPPLDLVFGSTNPVTVKAPATESYLVPIGGQWCPGIYAMDPSASFPLASILGSPVLRSSVVVFDRQKKQIGFAPHAGCK